MANVLERAVVSVERAVDYAFEVHADGFGV